MIKIEEILQQKGIGKGEFAKLINIIPQNINRTIKRLEENQSEIDSILSIIDYKPTNEETANFPNSNLSDLIVANREQAETINRQSKIIEALTIK